MDDVKADSGMSPIIGAILLMGLFFILVTVIQLSAVPTWNEDLEFDHSQEIQSDILQLSSSVNSVAAIGSPRTVTLDLGVRYPNRLVLINPPPATGSLRSTEGFINISNAKSRDPQTEDYWNGSRKSFENVNVTYIPDYNYYSNAPQTSYDNGLVYNYRPNQDGNSNATLNEQSMVNGKDLFLVAVNGSISTSKVGSEGVTLKPMSTSEYAVALTNESNQNITLSIDTRLTDKNWTKALNDVNHVHDVTSGNGDTVNVTLKGNNTYNLRMAEVGLDKSGSPNPHYITNIAGNRTNVSQNRNTDLTAQVRDRFNNPVSGVEVNATVVDGKGTFSDSDSNKTTGSSGKVTFTYEAPSGKEKSVIEMKYESPPQSERENTTFVVNVEPP
ncbi:MAG: Ig-like domain-containing protein [Halobacteria archaeon]